MNKKQLDAKMPWSVTQHIKKPNEAGFSPNMAFNYSSKHLPEFKKEGSNYSETIKVKPDFVEPKNIPDYGKSFQVTSRKKCYAEFYVEFKKLRPYFVEVFEDMVFSNIRHVSHDT